jgi:hypothetical protein
MILLSSHLIRLRINHTVDTAPITLQHDNVATYQSLYYTMKSNVFLSSGSDRSNPPGNIWLNRISTPANTAGWDCTGNVGARVAAEATLKLDNTAYYRPDDPTSPIFNAGFDWTTRFPSVNIPHAPQGGQYDIEGYSLFISGVGYSAGCWSGKELFIIPDTTPPTVTDDNITNITAEGCTLEVDLDGSGTVFFVVVADGASAPSVAQIRLGHNASNVAALDSGSASGTSVDQTITGLTINTAYDVYYFAEDSGGNRTAATKLDFTTSASGVAYVQAGAGASVTGTASPVLIPYPAVVTAGNFLIMTIAIKSASGIIGNQSGWTSAGAASQIGSTDSGEHQVFWKIASGSEGGTNHTVTLTTDAAVARFGKIYEFSGVHATVPIEAYASARANSTSVPDVGVTSTVNGSVALNFVSCTDDNAIGDMTGQTGGTWTKAETEYLPTNNNGAMEVLYRASLPTAGTINGGTATMAAADPFSVIGLVLKPA